jgi:hypothetical protein
MAVEIERTTAECIAQFRSSDPGTGLVVADSEQGPTTYPQVVELKTPEPPAKE